MKTLLKKTLDTTESIGHYTSALGMMTLLCSGESMNTISTLTLIGLSIGMLSTVSKAVINEMKTSDHSLKEKISTIPTLA